MSTEIYGYLFKFAPPRPTFRPNTLWLCLLLLSMNSLPQVQAAIGSGPC